MEKIQIPTFLSNVAVVLATNDYQETEQELGLSYQIQLKDVICGSRGSKDCVIAHPGNERFRVIVEMKIEQFQKATTRLEKTQVVRQVVDMVRQSQGRFIRQDDTTGIWYDIGNIRAREKAGHALRLACSKISPSSILEVSSLSSCSASSSSNRKRRNSSCNGSKSTSSVRAMKALRLANSITQVPQQLQTAGLCLSTSNVLDQTDIFHRGNKSINSIQHLSEQELERFKPRDFISLSSQVQSSHVNCTPFNFAQDASFEPIHIFSHF